MSSTSSSSSSSSSSPITTVTNLVISSAIKLYESPEALKDDFVAFLIREWHLHPGHILIEIAFVIAILYFLLTPPHKAKRAPPIDPPTNTERAELIQSFQSKPFKSGPPDSTYREDAMFSAVVRARDTNTITMASDDKTPAVTCADFTTFDFHSLGVNPEIKLVAKSAIRAYGVGSCGPRGFYGSIKPHLECENDISRFLGTEGTTVYSFMFATISTIIPCFSCRGDYLVVDDYCALPIQKGVNLSRATFSYYRHNDMIALEKQLKDFNADERKRGVQMRKYILTEGVFRNHGDICALPSIVALANKYKFRIILDDTLGFGALGPTGRGTPEHFGVPLDKIALYIGALNGSLGSIGGFCSGKQNLIDHQRLLATGYCFSASLPPYLTATASAALRIIAADPSVVRALAERTRRFRSTIRRLSLPSGVAMVECVDDASPIVHFKTTRADLLADPEACDTLFDAVVKECYEQHRLAVRRSIYNREEHGACTPSLRVIVKGSMSETEVERAAKVLVTVLGHHFP